MTRPFHFLPQTLRSGGLVQLPAAEPTTVRGSAAPANIPVGSTTMA
jgi:hypothetical protein